MASVYIYLHSRGSIVVFVATPACGSVAAAKSLQIIRDKWPLYVCFETVMPLVEWLKCQKNAANMP